MSIKIKMKRHESFSIREGWLAKGIKAIQNNDKVFTAQDATDILGIGTNMVKSLKYWMLATSLIEEKNKTLCISTLGKLIYEKDPYLEDIFSWWILHIHLIRNMEEAYIFNCFFNRFQYKNFSKKDIFEQISDRLYMNRIEFNEKILQDEINMIIKTYTIDETIDNPENNFVCPFSELNLIKKLERDTYEKNKPLYKDLHYLIVFYLIELIIGEKDHISIDDLLKISHENKIKNKLITNGKLLTKNRIDKIYKYLDSITLSIDSIDDEINNTLGRGINHFQEIKEILDYIHEKKYNVKVRINSVICKNNLETINKLVDFLNEYNIYSWRIFKFMPLREKAIINKNIFDITLDEYNNVIFYIKNNSNIRKIDTRVEEDMEKKYILILANGDIIKTESGKDKKIGVSVKSFVVKS